MAKRFTDTEKWKKPFIRGLQGPYKLLWFYILDDCDHSGIWQVDIEVAQIRMGECFNLELAIELFGDKIHVFDNGEKWFIPDFISFQYGELNPANRAHNSVIQNLNKYNIKPLVSPLQGCKDKDKDMDMVKEDSTTNHSTIIYDPEILLKELINSESWKAGILTSGYIDKMDIPMLNKFIQAFVNEQRDKDQMIKNLSGYKSYFINWIKKQPKDRFSLVNHKKLVLTS